MDSKLFKSFKIIFILNFVWRTVQTTRDFHDFLKKKLEEKKHTVVRVGDAKQDFH